MVVAVVVTVCSVLQSSPVAAVETVSPAADHSKVCAYELAKDFDDDGNAPKKDSDPIYTVPTSNRLITHIDNQQEILFRVSEKFFQSLRFFVGF